MRDPALRKSAVMDVATSAYDVGLGTKGVVASPLPGPAGNVEYFLWLKRGAAIGKRTIACTSGHKTGPPAENA